MNALIVVLIVLLRTGMGAEGAIFLWSVLAGAEVLADCFSSWLWRCWTVGRSELYLRAAIRDITARWRAAS